MTKGDHDQQQSEENPFINRPNSNNRPVDNNRQRNKPSVCSPINTNKKILTVICVLAVAVVFLIVFSVYKLFYNLPGHQNYTLQLFPVARDNSELIWVKIGNKEDAEYWANSLDQFLSPYKRLADTYDHNTTEPTCDGNNTSISAYYHCLFENTNCTETESYGYLNGSPCVVIKINKDFEELKLLSLHESADTEHYHHNSNNSFNILCDGQTVADMEYIGSVTYFPGQHLPLQYLSAIKNESDYMSPFVFVRFNRPYVGVVMYIECALFLPDMHLSNDTIKFQLLLDSM